MIRNIRLNFRRQKYVGRGFILTSRQCLATKEPLINPQITREYAPGRLLILIKSSQTFVSQKYDAGTRGKIYRFTKEITLPYIKFVPAIGLQST